MTGKDVWTLKARHVRAWKNDYGTIHTAPQWVWDAINAGKVERDNPESGHMLVHSEYLGDHVCEIGQYLTLSADDESGHIMACDAPAFEKAYEYLET